MNLVNLFACTESYVSIYELMKFIYARACVRTPYARAFVLFAILARTSYSHISRAHLSLLAFRACAH